VQFSVSSVLCLRGAVAVSVVTASIMSPKTRKTTEKKKKILVINASVDISVVCFLVLVKCDVPSYKNSLHSVLIMFGFNTYLPSYLRF